MSIVGRLSAFRSEYILVTQPTCQGSPRAFKTIHVLVFKERHVIFAFVEYCKNDCRRASSVTNHFLKIRLAKSVWLEGRKKRGKKGAESGVFLKFCSCTICLVFATIWSYNSLEHEKIEGCWWRRN